MNNYQFIDFPRHGVAFSDSRGRTEGHHGAPLLVAHVCHIPGVDGDRALSPRLLLDGRLESPQAILYGNCYWFQCRRSCWCPSAKNVQSSGPALEGRPGSAAGQPGRA